MDGIAEWVPLSTIAVKPNTCSVDDKLISKRCVRVALAIIVSSAAIALYLTKITAYSCRSVVKITCLDLMIPLFFIIVAHKRENIRANRRADEIALGQYSNPNLTPNASATQRIWCNEGLLSRLSETEILRKNNESQTILDFFVSQPRIDRNIFHRLVDKVSSIPKETFLQLLETRISFSIGYVLEQGKVTASSFSDVEQRDIWLSVGPSLISLLVKHKFNINAKGSDDLTALAKWAKTPHIEIKKTLKEQQEFVRAMLKSGAILTADALEDTDKQKVLGPILEEPEHWT